MKRKTILIIALVLLVLGAVAAIYGYTEYNRKNTDLKDEKAAFNITAAAILNEFSSSETIANNKYLGKVIEVTGEVKDIEKDDRGMYTVIIGESSSMSSVRCSMDSAHNHSASALASQKQVTIKGVCTGYNSDELLGSDLILGRCIIEKH